MIKQSATFGDWKVDCHDDNKIDVYKNGQLCEKSAPALREIADELGFEIKSEWRTSQLGRNVLKAMLLAENGGSMESNEESPMSLIEKLRSEFIIETDDEVYYDAEGCCDDDIRDMFINNIKAQLTDNEIKIFESLQYTSAEQFINYMDEQPDDINLPQILIAAAYCTSCGIEIDDDTREYVDEQLYYFNDCRDFHYEYESDIDLG